MRAPLLHSASAPTLSVLFRHLVQVQEIEALKTVAHEAPHGWALRQVPDCRALYQALDSQALYKPLICRDLDCPLLLCLTECASAKPTL